MKYTKYNKDEEKVQVSETLWVPKHMVKNQPTEKSRRELAYMMGILHGIGISLLIYVLISVL